MYFQGKPCAVSLAKKYDSTAGGNDEARTQVSRLRYGGTREKEREREKGVGKRREERGFFYESWAAWRPVNIIFGMKQSRRPLLSRICLFPAACTHSRTHSPRTTLVDRPPVV